MARPIDSGSRDIVLLQGARTPFARIGGAFRRASAAELGASVVREIVERSGLRAKEVDALVFGQVLVAHTSTNVAREVSIAAEFPPTTDAFAAARGSATGCQAIASAAMMIATGQASIVVAGGAESASDAPVRVSQALSEALLESARAKNPIEKLRSFTGLTPRDLVPLAPAPLDPVSYRMLGEGAERIAKRHKITREAQDAWADQSHQKARSAPAPGDIVPVFFPPGFEAIETDEVVERTPDEGRRKAPPLYEDRFGTVTGLNSAPLADGAAAILLARADVARALGLRAAARLKGFAFAGTDPSTEPLLGAAHAIDRVLAQAGATLADVSLLELHEGFAAETLAVLAALADPGFARGIGRSAPIGAVPLERTNVEGGAIAYGHPFAASGLRMAATVVRRLEAGLGLVAQSAGGGIGAALLFEKEPG